MTQPIVAADPPHGSIEAFAAIIRSRPDVERYLEGRGIAVIQALVDDRHATPAEKVDHIHNALAAVRKVGAELAGQLYSREPAEADDPTPVSPARGGAPHVVAVNNGGMVDETPADAAPLSAAIHFSTALREAARSVGLKNSERLQAATFDLLHGQALAEGVERAQRADVREGEQGRITNPNLAQFLATKEDARRYQRHFFGLEESAKHGQPAELLHFQFTSGDTSCGLTQGEYRDGCGTANQSAVTCKTCIDEMPF